MTIRQVGQRCINRTTILVVIATVVTAPLVARLGLWIVERWPNRTEEAILDPRSYPTTTAVGYAALGSVVLGVSLIVLRQLGYRIIAFALIVGVSVALAHATVGPGQPGRSAEHLLRTLAIVAIAATPFVASLRLISDRRHQAPDGANTQR